MCERPTIPKIIHQIWIGPKPRPWRLMDTFRDKHPEFEYVLWTEAEIARRGLVLENSAAFDAMGENWAGKADILRWEILWRYGGIYQDADSICLEPFDEELLGKAAFAAYENEAERPGLVSVGTMGFPPGHPLCRAAIDWIAANDTCPATTGWDVWMLTGPGLLTRLVDSGLYGDLHVFPSWLFIPYHFTGSAYSGHHRVYCHQIWGTTTNGYEFMNLVGIPRDLLAPVRWVSVLVSSYNTNLVFIRECLDSIRDQVGHFGIELVWIDDGSGFPACRVVELELERFRRMSRFVRVVYRRNLENLGIGASLHVGLDLCTCDLVVKMDSDDIMVADRIRRQIEFMDVHADCVMAGAQLVAFRRVESDGGESGCEAGGEAGMEWMGETNHPHLITRDIVIGKRLQWFMNHPTMIFRRATVLAVGGYNGNLRTCSEDYDLELRVLKRYGRLRNMPEVLVYYRIHDGQATAEGKSLTAENQELRLGLMRSILSG